MISGKKTRTTELEAVRSKSTCVVIDQWSCREEDLVKM